MCYSGPQHTGKGLEILGLRDAKKIVQLMRMLVSGKMGFAFSEKSGSPGVATGQEKKNVKSFTQLCIGYLCSAITTLTHNEPDTYTEIMRLCSEVRSDIEVSEDNGKSY